MKSVIRFFAVSLVGAALLSSCTINRPADQNRTITVNGTGTVNAAPDMAVLEFSVNTYSWFAKQAAADNAATMTKVIEAVKAAGVNEDDIETADYSIGQEKSWQNGRQILGRYTTSNTLRVVIHNTEITGDIIDTAVKAGANGLSSLQFRLSDTAAAVRQARTAAVQQAQDAAALLAGATGCKLGAVITITENNNFGTRSLKLYNAMADTATVEAATPIAEGKVSVTTSVTITYALQ